MPASPSPAVLVFCNRHTTVAKHKNAQGNRVCRECHKEAKARLAAKHVLTSVPVVARAPAADPAPHHAARGSFLAVAREYVLSQDNVAPSTATKRAYLLDQLRAIHDRPITELTTPDFVRALKAIEAAGDRRETAHRCGMLAAQVTRYAVNHGYAPVNVLPSGQLRGTLKPVKTDSHAAITEPARFGNLLKFIELYAAFCGSRSQPGVTAAIQLAPLLFVRPGELRNMGWSEVSLDKAEWVIPAVRMKMRRPHLVPLASQALTILREQHALTGKDRYAFRTKRRDEPLSENGFREALRTILHAAKEQPGAHTMHGFRSSASTLLNGELGVDSALIEMQLAHVKGDRVAGIYDRSQRLPERRAMMQTWADYIDTLRASKENV
jgi:integrase